MFDNAADADRFLSGTICYYDNVPIYIDRVASNMRVRARSLPLNHNDYDGLQGRLEFELEDPLFNYTQFNLGYVNGTTEAQFIMRIPLRGNSQGLCSQNVRTVDGARLDFVSYMYHDGFKLMMRGEYPTFNEAVRQLSVSEQMRGRAFSRNLAVRRHPEINRLIHICYKGRDIGWGDGDRFTIGDEYAHLFEIIEASGARIVI
jgi:hypothetical protein